MQKFLKFKMTDFLKILEIRPISGQAFCKFASFQAGNVWQRNNKRVYLKTACQAQEQELEARVSS
jgi:hypothetical protein